MMSSAILNITGIVRPKRQTKTFDQLVKANLGGSEINPTITGEKNVINMGSEFAQQNPTLVQQAGTQAGRVLEAGADIAVAPSKWIGHMQNNWYAEHITTFYTDPLRKLSCYSYK